MFSKPSAGITREEFHAVMRGAPATRKADDVYWVSYPDGDPWFVAEWKPDGTVLLSTSYSNARYLRNFPDMCDQAIKIARQLDARVFEEVEGREMTERNLDGFLDPSGEYVALQAGTWRHAIAQMSAQAQAPLEYPLGPIDIVSEYLLFHILPERPIEHDDVSALLQRALRAVEVEVAAEGAWSVNDAEEDRWLTKVLHRQDGKWQVWPQWGQSPFRRIAETTVAAAEHVHQAAGGEIQFLFRAFDDSLRSEVRARCDGLGVDFYTWARQLDDPR
jgi:hypothetical protein